MYDDAALARLDDAVIRMRRFWAGSSTRPVDETTWPGVELSTVLLADAVDRLGHGSPEAEVTVASVAARLDVVHSTASRLVDRAVLAGVLRRTPSAVDARRTVLVLTTAGTRLVADAVGHRRRFLRQALAGWAERDVATLAELLPRFADAVLTTHPDPRSPTEGERR